MIQSKKRQQLITISDVLRCMFNNCQIQNVSININSKSETTISPVKRSRNEMCNKQENGTFAPSMIPDMEFSRRKIAMDIY